MKYIRRFIYLGYYFLKLDIKTFKKFLREVQRKKKRTAISILCDVIYSVFRYNVSLLEYFQFHYYNLDHLERKTYAGTGTLYEYQLVMNPKNHRRTLEDKRVFNKVYKEFIAHDFADLESLKNNPGIAARLISNSSGKLVLKKHDGQCGIGIEVIDSNGLTSETVIKQMENVGNDMVESFITQHPDLMELSPSGLNTVRIHTQLTPLDEVDILGCRLRISVNSIVDNMAAGNMAAPMDTDTGMITGPAVYSDITKDPADNHPVTGIQILNFQVPYWRETISMIKRAALHNKLCRSVGWDVAITADGPELVEGNHDWCKLVWQLPVQKGLKSILDSHLENHKLNQKT